MGVKSVRRSDSKKDEDNEFGGMSRRTRNDGTTQGTATVPYYCRFAWKGIFAMHTLEHKYRHTRTVHGGLTATAAYVPSEPGENLRNGTTRNFRYLKPSFTFFLVKEFKLLLFCECTQHLRLIHQPTLLICYSESILVLH